MVTEDAVAKRLKTADTSQESVETLSLWCLHHKEHHQLVSSTWIKVFRTGSEQQRLALLYLANDVSQKASQKRGTEAVKLSLVPKILEAIALIRHDDSLKQRMERMFKIWEERNVFDAKTIISFKNALSMTFDDAPDVDERFILDFDTENLISDLEKHARCEESIEKAAALLPSLTFDFEHRLKDCLKDRRDGVRIVEEVETAGSKMNDFVAAIEENLKSHHALISALEQAKSFYGQQLNDATIVADPKVSGLISNQSDDQHLAYQKFGSGIQEVKDQLEEMLRTGVFLGASPPRDAPSPSAGEDPFAEGVEQAIVEMKRPGARDIIESSDMDLEDEGAAAAHSTELPNTFMGGNFMMNQSFMPSSAPKADPRLVQRYQKMQGGAEGNSPITVNMPTPPPFPMPTWGGLPPGMMPPPPFQPPPFNYALPPPQYSPSAPTPPASGPIISSQQTPPDPAFHPPDFSDNQFKGPGANQRNLTVLSGTMSGRTHPNPIPSLVSKESHRPNSRRW